MSDIDSSSWAYHSGASYTWNKFHSSDKNFQNIKIGNYFGIYPQTESEMGSNFFDFSNFSSYWSKQTISWPTLWYLYILKWRRGVRPKIRLTLSKILSLGGVLFGLICSLYIWICRGFYQFRWKYTYQLHLTHYVLGVYALYSWLNLLSELLNK